MDNSITLFEYENKIFDFIKKNDVIKDEYKFDINKWEIFCGVVEYNYLLIPDKIIYEIISDDELYLSKYLIHYYWYDTCINVKNIFIDEHTLINFKLYNKFNNNLWYFIHLDLIFYAAILLDRKEIIKKISIFSNNSSKKSRYYIFEYLLENNNFEMLSFIIMENKYYFDYSTMIQKLLEDNKYKLACEFLNVFFNFVVDRNMINRMIFSGHLNDFTDIIVNEFKGFHIKNEIFNYFIEVVIMNDNIEIFIKFIDKHIKIYGDLINATNYFYNKFRMIYESYQKSTQIFEYLVINGLLPDYGLSLTLAVSSGNIEITKFLLENYDYDSKKKAYVLKYAILKSYMDIIVLLLCNGANLKYIRQKEDIQYLLGCPCMRENKFYVDIIKNQLSTTNEYLTDLSNMWINNQWRLS